MAWVERWALLDHLTKEEDAARAVQVLSERLGWGALLPLLRQAIERDMTDAFQPQQRHLPQHKKVASLMLERLASLAIRVPELQPLFAEQTRAVAARVASDQELLTQTNPQGRLRLLHIVAPVAPQEALALLGSLPIKVLASAPDKLKRTLAAISQGAEDGQAKVAVVIRRGFQAGGPGLTSPSEVSESLRAISGAVPDGDLPGLKEEVGSSLIKRFVAGNKTPEAFLELAGHVVSLTDQLLQLGLAEDFHLGLNVLLSGLKEFRPATAAGPPRPQPSHYKKYSYGRYPAQAPAPAPIPATTPGKPYELPHPRPHLDLLLKRSVSVIRPLLPVSDLFRSACVGTPVPQVL
jgi:hypothetical protein